jgi:pseudaminic acid biosynthesis-associated methylase
MAKTSSSTSGPESKRLEELWQGEFGNDYTDRNRAAGQVRAPFWRLILEEFPAQRVLEVGCNLGANLKWIATHLPPQQVYGVDINLKALAALHQDFPEVNAIWSPARDLPFRDGWFDLVLTMGVLIHQPEVTLPLVMSEIVRCSRRYILCGEYFAEETTEVPYRNQTGALFKRNYGAIYRGLFPELKLRKQGFLGRDDGWDDVTYWLFEKP